MKNAKLAKFIVKQVLGASVALVIGYMMKMEKKLEDRIDEHYDDKSKTDQEDN